MNNTQQMKEFVANRMKQARKHLNNARQDYHISLSSAKAINRKSPTSIQRSEARLGCDNARANLAQQIGIMEFLLNRKPTNIS